MIPVRSAVQVQSFLWDFSKDGGALGQINTKIKIPLGASIKACGMVIITTPVNAGMGAFAIGTAATPYKYSGFSDLTRNRYLINDGYSLWQALLTESVVVLQPTDNGSIVIGETYTIGTYTAGDDFTNVGAVLNMTGETFIATGTTAAVWANGVGHSTLTSSGNPSVKMLDNTLGVVPWTYQAVGKYLGTLAGAFLVDTVFPFIQSTSGGGDDSTQIYRNNNNEVGIGAWQAGVLTDGLLSSTPVLIKVKQPAGQNISDGAEIILKLVDEGVFGNKAFTAGKVLFHIEYVEAPV